jgi:hypothetical protein
MGLFASLTLTYLVTDLLAGATAGLAFRGIEPVDT